MIAARARLPPEAVDFLRQGSLTLLLDGLNEIPRDSDDAYKARVGEWRDLVDAVDERYPGVRLLFACRPLVRGPRLLSLAECGARKGKLSASERG